MTDFKIYKSTNRPLKRIVLLAGRLKSNKNTKIKNQEESKNSEMNEDLDLLQLIQLESELTPLITANFDWYVLLY